MGCDIHAWAEKKIGGTWEAIPDALLESFFDRRSYRVFGWLAGVRNYADTPMISLPRDFPDDASPETLQDYKEWDSDAHTPSWVTLEELLSFDYNAFVEDRRYTKQVGGQYFNGGATCEPGHGKTQTWKEFLGEGVLKDLKKFKEAGVERIVFWFDN